LFDPPLPISVALTAVSALTSAVPAVVVTVGAVLATVVLGAWLRRQGWLAIGADATLLALLVRVFIPALIFTKVVGNDALSDWRNVVVPPAVAFGLVAGGIGLSLVCLRLCRTLSPSLRRTHDDPQSRRTFAVCAGMFNYGYITIPLVLALFPGETPGVLFVFNVGVEAAMWGVGVTLLAGMTAGWWRRALSPPVIATVAALAIDAAQRHLGVADWVGGSDGMAVSLLVSTITGLAAAAIPVGLLLTGATIYEDWHRCRMFEAIPTVGLAAVLRLLAFPAVFVAIAVLAPLTPELRRILVLQAAMPAAVFPIVLSRHYGGDPQTALRVVVGTSMLGLVTLPVWVMLGLWLVG
jgi:predicted permease